MGTSVEPSEHRARRGRRGFTHPGQTTKFLAISSALAVALSLSACTPSSSDAKDTCWRYSVKQINSSDTALGTWSDPRWETVAVSPIDDGYNVTFQTYVWKDAKTKLIGGTKPYIVKEATCTATGNPLVTNVSFS